MNKYRTFIYPEQTKILIYTLQEGIRNGANSLTLTGPNFRKLGLKFIIRWIPKYPGSKFL